MDWYSADAGGTVLRADAGVAALCARAAVLGGGLNVAINAKDLTDAAEREDFLSRARALEEEAGRREAAVLALVRAAVD